MADAIDILAEAIAGIDTAVHKLKHELLEEPEDDGTHERVRGLLVQMTIRLSQLTRVGEDIDVIARELSERLAEQSKRESEEKAALEQQILSLQLELSATKAESERLSSELNKADFCASVTRELVTQELTKIRRSVKALKESIS